MIKKISIMLLSAVTVIMCFSPVVMADDTEIYTNSGIVPGEPFVMFMLDYRANLNSVVSCDGACKTYLGLTGSNFTRFDILRAVLKKVMEPISNMKVGFMMTHQHNQNCAGPDDSNCSNGAFVVSGFKSMGDATAKTDLYAKIDAVPNPSGSTSHSYQGKEMMFEFFRYLTGQRVYNGHLGYKDYGDNMNSTMDSHRDLSIEIDPDTEVTNTDETVAGRYVSPFDPITDRCAKVFTVNFMFGDTQQEDDSDSAITTAGKRNGGMDGIDFATHHNMGHSGSGNTLNNMLNWMSNIDDLADGTWGTCPNVLGKQRVTSFFVTEGANLTANEFADAGGTTQAFSWSDDPYELVDTLKSMIAEILSVSTTFTAASVPVSVLNRSQVVDNVYIALFQADELGRVRWPGNIKKLKLDATNGLLVDTSNTNAIATDGRIKNDALTFWTLAGDLPPPDLNDNEVAGKDGRSVPRGGAGQRIPGFIASDPELTNADGARQLYYEPADAGDLLSTAPLNADSDTASALQSALGAADATEAEALLKFARGFDTAGTTARSWILGDSLHSRPLPINYGSASATSQPDIRLFMGTNDGFMHMFKNTESSGTELGTEGWAFMPTEVMGVVKTLYNNNVSDHPYGVDGPPSAYLHDHDNNGVIGNDGDDKAWLFFGLRRGGKAYYGLDVTDPDAPEKLWTITKSTTGFGELGLTFSQPSVGMLDYDNGDGVAQPVVMFAGGYDTNKDTRKNATSTHADYIQAAVGTDDSEGYAIYIVDARTGDLVWKAAKGSSATPGYVAADKAYYHPDLKDSIPSTLTTLDTNNDKLVDRMYVGDTGGNVWRVDTLGDDPAQWTIVKLASLGRPHTANDSNENDRRFFHRPDFVKFKDGTGSYDAVIIGSGSRSRPLDTNQENWVYMIKDRNIDAGNPPTTTLTHTDLGDVTNNCLQEGTCGNSAPSLSNGWRMELEQSGEKALATATTINKVIYFTTYKPADVDAIVAGNSCEPGEGTGRLYAVDLRDARAVVDYSVANGTDLEKQDRFVDLKSGGIPAEVVYVPFDKILKPDLTIQNTTGSNRWKWHWYPAED